ncbi:hypothetical protein ACOY5P_24140 [Enterobacter asburiae]|uniref:hypothetical protein n=1 Tax=Enterobacter asburiae TaxID=61645 RepID=UPI002FF7C91E
MTDFQWIADEDQIFDDSYGGDVTLTQGPYDKNYGKSFTLNTQYTLKLTGATTSVDNRGRWQGNFYLIKGKLEIGDQKNGVWLHIGLDGIFNIRSELIMYGYIQLLGDLEKFQVYDNGMVAITYHDPSAGIELSSTFLLEDNASMSLLMKGDSFNGYNGINIYNNTIQIINNASFILQTPKIIFNEMSQPFFVLGGFKNEDGNGDVEENANITFKDINKKSPIDFTPGSDVPKGIFNFRTTTDDGQSIINKGKFIIYGVTSGFTLANLKGGGYVSIEGVPQQNTDNLNYRISADNTFVEISLK